MYHLLYSTQASLSGAEQEEEQPDTDVQVLTKDQQ